LQLFTSKQYLKIDIANSFGLDKLTWDERLVWFDLNEHQLPQLHSKAKEPALYYAGVQAWQDVLRGDPIGYPISLDATASGLQILAVLTGDRSAAGICNVVDMGKRMDAYTAIYEKMVATLGEAAKIERDDTKRAIMTSLYGSTNVPKEVFGEGELLKVFQETMAEMAPAAWELNRMFLEMWDPEALTNDWTLPDNFHVHVKVTTKITETVNFLNEPFDIIREINAPKPKGRSLGANVVHSLDGMIVRELARRCSYDPAWIQLVRDVVSGNVESRFTTRNERLHAQEMVRKLWRHYQDSGYLSARILDYIDSDTLTMVDPLVIQELLDSLPPKPFTIISVHDCFRVLPNYGNDLRKQYNRQLYLLAKSDILAFLLSQLLKKPIEIEKMDETLADDILEANYALS
jgi:hypothetical protein